MCNFILFYLFSMTITFPLVLYNYFNYIFLVYFSYAKCDES